MITGLCGLLHILAAAVYYIVRHRSKARRAFKSALFFIHLSNPQSASKILFAF